MVDHQKYQIKLNGQEGLSLIASCGGHFESGGGLFSYNGSALERIDWLSCSGLALAGQKVVRNLCGIPGETTGEFIIYDEKGVERYFRMDKLTDVHDIIWNGTNLIAVSSEENQITWISLAGDIVNEWRAPGDGDSWHLNSLMIRDGHLYATAFGRFREHREWKKCLHKATGILFSVDTAEDIITGLCNPHHPRFLDGKWVICESGCHDLIAINPITKNVHKRVNLGGWTRGLAISDDYLFIGVSAMRHEPASEGATAKIMILSRGSWEVLGQLTLPTREICNLIVVSESLVEGLRRGFRTNPHRSAEQDQLAMFTSVGVRPSCLWAVGDKLALEDCRIRMEARMPQDLYQGQVLKVNCAVENIGNAIFVSAPPYPVHLSYRWLRDEEGTLVPVEGRRTLLSRALFPHSTLTQFIEIQAPLDEGDYYFRPTLVQESIRWFDDVTSHNLPSYKVRVSTRAINDKTELLER